MEHLQVLNEERARIARDMHDVVGARLTQLSVMHDIFSTEHALPKEAVAGLSRLNRVTREDYNPRNSTTAELVYRVFRFGTTLIGDPEHTTHGAQGSGPRRSTR
ncbi:MAG: hypothetical protein EBV45_13095 [Chloroflexi bacterium]|nr:hypothetical protein [Chloroflexota bacterium]